ncbi:MAG: mitochondrial Homoaconitase [Sarcosagium campestre]|nr:MAG: mitochondrial Homoaconitase [Sarcosagium campestre]
MAASAPTKTVLRLRSESKPLEHRSALTPSTTAELLKAGYDVKVERSPERIFSDDEFSAVGATLTDEYSWPSAPRDDIIVGLKELPDKPAELPHTHVQFAHVFKEQDGWTDTLRRYADAGGTLLDLEFLTDERGRRVAAFGYHAGFCGAALAIKNWAWGLAHPDGEPIPAVQQYTDGKGFYKDEAELLAQIREDIANAADGKAKPPRVLVIGALGRCGTGAVELCEKVGIPSENILQWDMQETAKGGPFKEIVDSDIFVNCIYLDKEIPPFIDVASLSSPDRKLSVICDVSCDVTSNSSRQQNPKNPIRIPGITATTFDSPAIVVKDLTNPPLSVIAIDHLPSMLPREASEAFSHALLPSLLQLNDWKNSRVWREAEKLYETKVELMRSREA